MNCPLCGTPNAYQGLIKISCENTSCKNYDLPSAPIIKSSNPAGTAAATTTQSTTQKIANQKYVAQKILSNLPNAIIAGGAPRNWEFGRPSNDIDVFLFNDDSTDIESMVKNAFFLTTWNMKKKGANAPPAAPTMKAAAPYNVFKEITGVYEGTIPIHGEKIQFIYVLHSNWNSLQDFVIETFDFGLNKIWMRSDGTIDKAYSFIMDVINQTLTINIESQVKYDRYRSLPERTKKMLSYFPNFKLAII